MSILCEQFGVAATLWICAAVFYLNMISLIAYCVLDIIYERKARKAIQIRSTNVNFKELKHVRVEFWIICTICGIFYSCIYPFISIAKLLFI